MSAEPTPSRTFDVPIQMRPTDVIGGHVNNALLLLYVETAREQFYRYDVTDRLADRDDFDVEPGSTVADILLTTSTVRVSNLRAEYRIGFEFSVSPVICKSWVSRIGGSSFDLAYQLESADGTQIYAVVHSGMVLLDRDELRPRPLDELQRATLSSWLGEPFSFR